MAEDRKDDFPGAADYGRSLRGFGVNLLVSDLNQTLSFLKTILGIEAVHKSDGFAVLVYKGQEWMLHEDGTYHSNPLLSLTGDGVIRGAGVELRLYDVDPDAAEDRARQAGYTVLQSATNKPHGLRECYLVDRDGYVWVPGVGISNDELPKDN